MCCLFKMGTMRKASEHSAQLGLKEQSLSGVIWETHTDTHTHAHTKAIEGAGQTPGRVWFGGQTSRTGRL